MDLVDRLKAISVCCGAHYNIKRNLFFFFSFLRREYKRVVSVLVQAICRVGGRFICVRFARVCVFRLFVANITSYHRHHYNIRTSLFESIQTSSHKVLMLLNAGKKTQSSSSFSLLVYSITLS